MSELHCQHGTYVGTPSGPDYLCGYCEQGLNTPVPVTRYRVVVSGVSSNADGNKPIGYVGPLTTKSQAQTSSDLFNRLPLDEGASWTASVESVTNTVWVDGATLNGEQQDWIEREVGRG